jgi:hypothetical protein
MCVVYIIDNDAPCEAQPPSPLLVKQARRHHTRADESRSTLKNGRLIRRSHGEVFIASKTDMPWRTLRDKMKGWSDDGREKRGASQ